MPGDWQAKFSTATKNRGNLTESLTLAQCDQPRQAAAPAARPQLLAAFFGKTDAGTEPDISYWRSHVDNLPEESRENAVSAFTSDLARSHPLQVLDFDGFLPEGSLRQEAFTRVAGAWTAADSIVTATAYLAQKSSGGRLHEWLDSLAAADAPAIVEGIQKSNLADPKQKAGLLAKYQK